MNLARAIDKFALSPVYGWDYADTEWIDTSVRGRLQVYDRVISSHGYSQKKRVLTVARDVTIPSLYDLVRVGDLGPAYMIENATLDVEGDDAYASSFSLHMASFHLQVCKRDTVKLRSGVQALDDEEILFDTWGDIDRFSNADSTEFENTTFTVSMFTLPSSVVLDTDMYIRRVDNGQLFDVNEVYQQLRLPVARCQRRGS